MEDFSTVVVKQHKQAEQGTHILPEQQLFSLSCFSFLQHFILQTPLVVWVARITSTTAG